MQPIVPMPRRFRDVSISTKMFIVPVLTLCALLLLALLASAGLRGARQHAEDLSEGAFETYLRTANVRTAISEVQDRLLNVILVSATNADASRVLPRIVATRQAERRARLSFEALSGRLRDLPAITGLTGQWQQHLDAVDELLQIVETDAPTSWVVINEVNRSFTRLSAQLTLLQLDANAMRRTAARNAVTEATVANSAFIAVVVLAVMFSVCATLIVARSITRPIMRLAAATGELAGGNLGVAIPECDRADEVGLMAGAIGVFKDGLIEANRLAAERDAIRARELLGVRQLADATFEGVVIHRQGEIIEVNTMMRTFVGEPDGEAMRGRSVADFVAPSYRDIVERMVRQPGPGKREVEILHASGSVRPVEVLSRSLSGEDGVSVLALRDLSESRAAEAEIRRLAFQDSLTGLPNRTLLNERLAHGLEIATRNGTQLAVLSLNLDRFKFVNDLLGHNAGDELLAEVASRLSVLVRASDTVARMGGDDFVVVQALTSEPQQSAVLAKRIIEAIAEPFEVQGRSIEVGVSIGIASFPADGNSAPVLLKNSDTALNRAKSAGRGQFQFFEPEMESEMRRRRHLEWDLRQAFTDRDLELFFQPLWHCATQEVDGFEALLRWPHRTRGMVMPSEFVPLAEESGLIVPIGRWVLEEACAAAVAWPRPWWVAVNLSPAQLRDPDFPAMVEEVLGRTGLPPRRLELEVTESVLISNPEQALASLTRLREIGISISLDDFGTGYSSLSYLRRFPFDKLKIDKSFLQEFEKNPDAEALVGAIVGLGHALHISVTGEGVETRAQLELLARLRCNHVQGFLLGRPVPPAEMAAVLRRAAGTVTAEAVVLS